MPDTPKTGGDDPESTPLLGLRSAMILTLAVLVGIGAGVLITLAGRHPAEAILYGVGASAASVLFFNRVIDR